MDDLLNAVIIVDVHVQVRHPCDGNGSVEPEEEADNLTSTILTVCGYCGGTDDICVYTQTVKN